jgi:hypothetical protein
MLFTDALCSKVRATRREREKEREREMCLMNSSNLDNEMSKDRTQLH